MRYKNIFPALAVIGLALTGAACSSSSTSESTGQYLDSSVISTKVRAQIAKDEKVSIFDIDVKTFKDVVQLSGFVNSEAEKARAGQIAAGVEGVRHIRNNITVKPK